MNDSKEKRYTIGNKVYVQRPLFLGEILQLIETVKDIRIPGVVNSGVLLLAFGNKLPEALAVILTEDGTDLKNKDLKSIADELSFSVSAEQTMEILESFFDGNPIYSWLDRIGKLMKEKAIKKEETESLGS